MLFSRGRGPHRYDSKKAFINPLESRNFRPRNPYCSSVPRRPLSDAEIEADIDENCTDRATAVLGGDLFERERGVEGGIPSGVMQPGGWFLAGALFARLGRRRSAAGIAQVLAAGGEPAEPFFEGCGAEQATGDAGEDQGEIAGYEGSGDVGEAGEDPRIAGVPAQRVGEIPAVGDERVKEGEELADARGQGPIGGIGLEKFGRCGACVEHDWNKSTEREPCQRRSRTFFVAGCWGGPGRPKWS